MNSILKKINADIYSRTIAHPSQDILDQLSRDFNSNLALPLIASYKSLITKGDLSNDDFTAIEARLGTFEGSFVVTQLSGFGSPYQIDDSTEIYDIVVGLSSNTDLNIELNACIERSTNGEGSFVRNWDMLVNDETVDSLIRETDSEELIHNFAISDFLSEYEYNVNQKKISEEDINIIADILGIAAEPEEITNVGNDTETKISETDIIIEELFSSRWSGDLSNASLKEKRMQLYKNLKDQTRGFWSGHTAYHIMIDGGFLIDSKRLYLNDSNHCKGKKLTYLGNMFMKSMEAENINIINELIELDNK